MKERPLLFSRMRKVFRSWKGGKEGSRILFSVVILIYLFPERLTDGRKDSSRRSTLRRSWEGLKFPPPFSVARGGEQEITLAARKRFRKVRCRQLMLSHRFPRGKENNSLKRGGTIHLLFLCRIYFLANKLLPRETNRRKGGMASLLLFLQHNRGSYCCRRRRQTIEISTLLCENHCF